MLFFVVERRIGDVESIRELLANDGTVELDAVAIEAVQAGYVWALLVMAALTVITMASAMKLVKSRTMFENVVEPNVG